MKSYLLTKTDWIILILFLGISALVSLALWVLPSDLTRDLAPAAPVAVAVALFLIIRRHDRRVDHQARQDDYRQMETWVALQPFIKSQLPLSGLRGGALSPDMAEILCRELLTLRPGLVVECGAGISTIIIGYLLKGLGKGKLVTLEHDHEWTERVASWIAIHDLAEQVVVLHSPLIEQQIGDNKAYWYNIKDFHELRASGSFGNGSIDVLFVDGPPESVAAYIRRPAVPVMQQWFAPNCSVVVDDANRPAEADIVRQWCDSLGSSCECEWFATEKGAAIIRIVS